MAREAWTDADVKSSQGYKQCATAPLSVQPEISVPNLRKEIAKFWAEKSEGFKAMWASLSKAHRERLIRTSCPHIAVSKKNSKCVCGCQDMSGMKMLLPELTLESLVTGPNDLVSLLEIHGCGSDAQDAHDIDYIRSLEGIAFPKPPWPPRRMVTFVPKRGATFEIKQFLPDMAKLFETGLVIDEQTWQNVCMRQVHLLTFLATICDEYSTEWEKSTTAYSVSSAAFTDADATEADRIEVSVPVIFRRRTLPFFVCCREALGGDCALNKAAARGARAYVA
jgi:hypothetical protein